jgi:glycosyltransferase involved in cell wall biosynthesis
MPGRTGKSVGVGPRMSGRRAPLGGAPTALARNDGVGEPEPRAGRTGGNGHRSALGELDDLAEMADRVGLRRIRMVAWRDLDDPEAGGSELHAHRIASRWAQAGLDVTLRTSAVPGRSVEVRRDGYVAVRRSGRYGVFPAVAAEGLQAPVKHGEGLVEIWNGMPFFSPLWFRGPRVVFLHHVHAEMWRMTLPGWLARAGEVIERLMAPPLYRRSRVVTLSESSRQEIVSLLGIPPSRVSVASPGVGSDFTPGGSRSPHPLVIAVGRLVPVKRYDLLIRALAATRAVRPDLRAVIIGEGYERPKLEALRRRLGADSWLQLPGHLPDHEVVEWYRQAWVVASASRREGWGMTLTEAGACGTPAVATRIAGHADAVVDGKSGLLATDEGLAAALERVVTDDELRDQLGRGALAHASTFTWEATARRALEALVGQVGHAPTPAHEGARRG